IVFFFLLSSFAFAQDVVLVNGAVIDGTGKPRIKANVRIHEGKIGDIGVLKPAPTDMMLDVKGMVIAPGFVDFQTISASTVAQDPSDAGLLAQGVTTALIGSDGTGPYSVEDFMMPFDEKPPALNIAVLAGHATVRRQIMGPDYKRSTTADELQRMSEL